MYHKALTGGELEVCQDNDMYPDFDTVDNFHRR